MDLSWGAMQVFFLFMFTVHLSSTDTHTLQFFYTGVTPGINFPEFIAISEVDGEESEYYDSSIRKAIPKAEWIKNIEADEQDYWKSETEIWQEENDWIKADLDKITRYLNHGKGVHTMQLLFGCELHDNNTTEAFSHFGYDGEDFISLDLKTITWTPVSDTAKAVFNENWWTPTGHKAEYCTFYLKHECIFWLKKFVNYGKETRSRKVRPETSLFQKNSSSTEVVCHATGFFPKYLHITWQKDGKDMHEDVDVREALPNQDGTFQKRSILKVQAENLQKHEYTCVIQHSSLGEELLLPVSECRILRGGGSHGAPVFIIIGVIAALVSAAAAAGFFFLYRYSAPAKQFSQPHSTASSHSNEMDMMFTVGDGTRNIIVPCDNPSKSLLWASHHAPKGGPCPTI